jgi:hypothetical protein
VLDAILANEESNHVIGFIQAFRGGAYSARSIDCLKDPVRQCESMEIVIHIQEETVYGMPVVDAKRLS